MEDQVGQVFHGRYLVERSLAPGGMGVVYEAVDQLLGIKVAVKKMVCPTDRAQEEIDELCQQFVEEARTLARLQHPHLVRVIDFFTEDGDQYLVMDFAEGESLYDRIVRQGKLSETEIVTLAGQLLDALDYCHQNKVYHRDVKPRNVIIGQDGRARLVDFGLVKLGEKPDQLTRAVIRGMGTPEYAPPEQVGTSSQHTDARSDVYSLGATLYHGLTGHAPPTVTQRVAGIERLEPIHTFVPGVSSRLEQVVLKALQLRQDDRWQSAREMASALGVSGGTADLLPTRSEGQAPTQQIPAGPVGAEPHPSEPHLAEPRPAEPPSPKPAPGARRARRRFPWVWVGVGAVVVAVAGVLLGTGVIPTALSDPTATLTPTATAPRATETTTATSTATSTAEPTFTATSPPTATATTAPTSTPTDTPVATSAPTDTPAPTLTPTLAASPTPAPRWLAAPSLVAPKQGESFTGWNAQVILQWSNVGPLGENEYYVVRIPYDPAGNTAEFWRKDTAFEVPAHFSQANVGFDDRHYHWTVQAMRCTSHCDQTLDDQVHKDGTAVGTESALGLFYWHSDIGRVPPTATPVGGGNATATPIG